MKLAKIDKEQWDAINDAISSCWEMWEEEGIEPSLVAYMGLFRFSMLAKKHVDPRDFDLFVSTAIESEIRFDEKKGKVKYDG